MNGHVWEHPSAEVVKALAVEKSYVFPAGKDVHVDARFDGAPNLQESDPNKLNLEIPPERGVWTRMTVHTHPVADIPDPINTKDDCKYRLKSEEFTFDYKGKKILFQSSMSPSVGDLKTQSRAEAYEIANAKKEKRSIRLYRSVIVCRYFIVLYNCKSMPDGTVFISHGIKSIMKIKRKKPDTKI